MKLIDKDALVAEIEILKNMPYPCKVYEQIVGFCDALERVLSILNTIEVKEINIEKEIKEHAESMPQNEFSHDNEVLENIEWAKNEFKHFFKLGLKAQKGEKV